MLPPSTSSAGNTRGLIEALAKNKNTLTAIASSAGNTRGLIEALSARDPSRTKTVSSAGNTRGLIEATATGALSGHLTAVFRGEYPRPH